MVRQTGRSDHRPDALLSTTYYECSGDGNVTRIITEHVAESAASGAEAGQRGLRGGDRPAPSRLRTWFKMRDAQDERAGDSSDASTAGACGAGKTRYTAVRLGYAANGRAVTFVHDESWCWNPQVGGCPTNYTVTYAREFRYDGARARHLNRTLDPVAFKIGSIAELDAVWTDYDGDEVYGDYRVTPGYPPTIGPLAEYEPGVWRKVGGVPDYLHNDHLGTLRQTTGTTGSAGTGRVFTAFGERLPGSATDRFGYVGAYGYQSTLDSGAEVFPYLHVGARYYDPSSGRFLQRDPIGVFAGPNVYAYVENSPADGVDPNGLWRSELRPDQKIIEEIRKAEEERRKNLSPEERKREDELAARERARQWREWKDRLRQIRDTIRDLLMVAGSCMGPGPPLWTPGDWFGTGGA